MAETNQSVRPQGRWLVKKVARQTGQSEAEVETSLNELIACGHIRVLRGVGPGGQDEFQPVIHGEDTSDLRISVEDF